MSDRLIDAVLFDYGGVIAEEGFVWGLTAISEENGLDRNSFMASAFELIETSGYLIGKADEAAFWKAMREATGVKGNDKELSREILSRFVLRPWVLALADDLRSLGITAGILSDQTSWLDQLDKRDRFFRHFDIVFNSFHMGMSKREQEVFGETARRLGLPGSRICFIDDNEGNCARAEKNGWQSIIYKNGVQVLRDLAMLVPDIDASRYETTPGIDKDNQ
ncbi:MAG: HAD family phosphatase [Syntrophales bacterium]|nr:HAD family phosphatase [Syntrophales bacterium]